MGEKKRKLNVNTTRTKPMTCLDCGATLEAATNYTDGATPEPGSVMICIICGHIMILDENGELRNPNDEEVLEIAGHEEILRHQKALAALRFEKHIRKHVEDVMFAKMEHTTPVIAFILNTSSDIVRCCATADSMPGHVGYGSDRREALRALLNSYAQEVIRDETDKYNQRTRN